jgi:hypothetical protein
VTLKGAAVTHASSFLSALIADGPAPEHAEELMLYGQFVGDWTTETRAYPPGGGVELSTWDVRFDWVLEGRAIQDVWISPPRSAQRPGWHAPGNRYSTTLRVYDPRARNWQIIWVNPPSGTVVRQIARAVGSDIVQDADPDASGMLSRWVYRDIRPDSFRWCSEESRDQGATWKLVQEMRATRVKASA